jgi:NADH pyrophosphatase NudC (nudix superfamily)
MNPRMRELHTVASIFGDQIMEPSSLWAVSQAYEYLESKIIVPRFCRSCGWPTEELHPGWKPSTSGLCFWCTELKLVKEARGHERNQ